MNKRIFAVLGIVALLVALFPAPAVRADPVVPPPAFPRNSMVPAGPDPTDLSVEMLGEDEIAIRKQAAIIGSDAATHASLSGEPAAVGGEVTITVSDSGANVDYDQTFVVVLDGTWGIILIEKEAYEAYDSATGEYVFPNPNGCWRTEDRISHAQLEYLLGEFDNTIFPTVADVYGEPLARGEEGKKTWILIFNIRDEAYYDCTATTYTAGYFSASESAQNNKNIMHIDSYDWARRVGPGVARPYEYEGVFAHEYEHLVHFDIDPDEESWVDEGMADLSGFLCGYGHPSSHIYYYLVNHPFTSLTFWGGGLESYGASYLFQLYLYEKFGGAPFISALVQEQANSIEGVEKTLAASGYRESFDEIFDNWAIANYIDDTNKAGGKYGYQTLDIGSVETRGYTIPYALANFWWGPAVEAPFTIGSDYFGNPQPYTAHYYSFFNKKVATLSLDGDDFAGTLPNSGEYEWYSGAEAWAWRSFYQSFDIPAGGATLEFMTFFDIEEDWDYGYVEVYDQNTGEWYTLDAAGTVDNVAHEQDNPNTPAGREPSDYLAAGRWHAFTGNSGGWVPVTMDLDPFAGHTIDLYFRTWQDGAFTLQMMYVDDIAIPELGFSDDVELGADGWTPDGWTVSTGKFANNFGIATMDTKWISEARYPEPAKNSAMTLHSVSYLTVDPETQSGSDLVSATTKSSGHVKVAIITNHADHILNSGYLFDVK